MRLAAAILVYVAGVILALLVGERHGPVAGTAILAAAIAAGALVIAYGP